MRTQLGVIISPTKDNRNSNYVSVKLVLGETLPLGEQILELEVKEDSQNNRFQSYVIDLDWSHVFLKITRDLISVTWKRPQKEITKKRLYFVI